MSAPVLLPPAVAAAIGFVERLAARAVSVGGIVPPAVAAATGFVERRAAER